jgi:nitroimidazol reductase NimA-like FMN-containing flavoprotein (pyridoxamine 5'-phosphate oxidase superfamily)
MLSGADVSSMTTKREAEMSAAAVDGFLGRHETGVLALADASVPYAIPISYGYHEADREVYLRLVSTVDSEKRAFLGTDPAARLVVSEEDGESYASVVATGTLERVDPSSLSPEDIVQYGDTRRPLFEIWADDVPDLDIELYRLDPDRLSGRTVVLEDETQF